MKKEKSIPRSIRFQSHVWEMIVKNAQHLGMKVPSYLSQLIVKDNAKRT